MVNASFIRIASILVVIGCIGCGDDDPKPATSKDISSFSFTAATNAGLPTDVVGTISGSTISAVVPNGTDLSGLVATFETTGASVTVGGTEQISGVTVNSFAQQVSYRVTAADDTTRNYTVTVTAAASNAKELTAFAFLDVNNAGLTADVVATIQGTSVDATVPFGTDVTSLVATFASTGTTVSIGGVAQVSGTTPNDFTTPLTYGVTAADGSKKDYTITVTIASATAKEVTAYSFLSADNAGLTADVVGTIAGDDIAVTLPFGTDVTALVAAFSVTGTSVTVGATSQVSSTTANDFSSPVVYTVTAADSSTRNYTVTITVALSSAKNITSFAFLSVDNPGLTSDITATITGSTINAIVPLGTDVTALVATFATTGQGVSVGLDPQVSGSTANDFSSLVTYTVTAADSSTDDYSVTVTEQ